MSAPASPPTPSARPPACHILVPCAGVGARSGADRPKQYVPVAGVPLVVHTLRRLCAVPGIATVMVVLSPEDDWLPALLPDDLRGAVTLSRSGGATRAETVLGGLNDLRQAGAEAQDWVLVHDAARCLIRVDAVQRLLAACADHPAGGLLAWPLADTLKQAQVGVNPPAVAATLPRSDKWLAQTPQMARLGVLQSALNQADASVTDESSALEALGLNPLLVLGHWDNLKVTYPGDFELAERLMPSSPAFPTAPAP